MNERATVQVGVPTPSSVCPHTSACITTSLFLKSGVQSGSYPEEALSAISTVDSHLSRILDSSQFCRSSFAFVCRVHLATLSGMKSLSYMFIQLMRKEVPIRRSWG